uniref:PDZ and LIM domain protein 5-like isoform X9 n=1 Tax=Pristiophorus japonicus TaxID=55135 RepID=UPI00398F7470
MSNYSVSLHGPAPWGFRLQGGKDFNMPLTISRLSEGGKAAQASIEVGDVVLSIDGVSTDGMAHLAAQNKIKACTGSLKLSLQRASPAAKVTTTTVQKDESKEVTHTVPVASIAPMAPKIPSASSSAYNKTARPFGASASPKVTPTSASPQPALFAPASSPLTPPPPLAPALHNSAAAPPSVPAASLPHVHVGANGRPPPVTAAKPSVTPSVNVPWQPKVYNTPINLYSSDNVHEVAEGQRRGQREGQSDAKQQNGRPLHTRSPRRFMTNIQPDVHHHILSDQSKKRLMQDTEDWQPKTGTAQSRSFCILAQMTGTEHLEMPSSETNKKTRISGTENGEIGYRFIHVADETVSKIAPNSPSGAVGINPGPLDTGKHSVAVQTCDIPTLAVALPAPNSTRAADPTAVSERDVLVATVPISSSLVIHKPVSAPSRPAAALSSPPGFRTILENPLAALPRSTPHLSPVKQSPEAKTAAATITAVLAAQARLSDPVVSRALLDALLIAPVARPLADQHCKLPKRVSMGSLYTPKNKSVTWHESVTSSEKASLIHFSISPIKSANSSGNSAEVSQPIGPATASVKPMSKLPSGICRTSPAAAKSGLAFKPSGVPGAVKPSGWQPGNPAVNNFPKVALPTAHVSPANQPGWAPNPKVSDTTTGTPGQQDDASLVQMAEHIPAGNRTPMCGHCNLIIRGPFLVAMGRSWHPEEFTCAYCNLSLANIGFVEEKGSVYCEKCYGQFFAPECSRCQRKILGEIINALKQTWHVSCFVCVACMQPIRNNVFHMEDGDPYCEKDYYDLFGTSCHGCDFPIEAGDKFLQALGHTWHDTCFVCAVCCVNLEGQTFFSKKDKLLCKKHAHTINV